MNDVISRQTAINTIMGQPPEAHYPSWYAEQIKKLPPAQPETHEERKTGHWVGAKEYCNHLNDEANREGRTEKYMPSGMVIGVYCDQCWAINTKRGNYCSNCGARMEGDT